MTLLHSPLATAPDVIGFWFGDEPHDAASMAARFGLWFGKSDETDATLRARFGSTIAAALVGELDEWANSATGLMALVLLTDQFTRNVLRGRPQMYAGDVLSLALARRATQSGLDRAMPLPWRMFLYLPFEHSEDLADQQQSVALFRALMAEAPEASQSVFGSALGYAEAHLEVIARFGRFPHRNAILGRESTAEEREYLAQPGAGF